MQARSSLNRDLRISTKSNQSSAGFNTNSDAAISFTMYEREAKEQIKWEEHGSNSIFRGHSPGSTR